MKHKKIIPVFVIAIIIIGLATAFYFSCNYTETGIEKYNEKISENEDLIHFSLDELGDYEEIYFQSSKRGGILFFSYSSMLIATYSSDKFLIQKDIIDGLEYEAEPLLFEETKYTLPGTELEIGDWDFKVLCGKSDNYTIPKNIDIIAVNEKSEKIAYLTFYD
ncbi:MAG: hypothetical protein LUG95_03675 [Clostridiales bacterium]|nr:hypothetical protein [Clostridiales bacterium]